MPTKNPKGKEAGKRKSAAKTQKRLNAIHADIKKKRAKIGEMKQSIAEAKFKKKRKVETKGSSGKSSSRKRTIERAFDALPRVKASTKRQKRTHRI